MLNRNADVCITGFSEGRGISNISVLSMVFTRGSVCHVADHALITWLIIH